MKSSLFIFDVVLLINCHNVCTMTMDVEIYSYGGICWVLSFNWRYGFALGRCANCYQGQIDCIDALFNQVGFVAIGLAILHLHHTSVVQRRNVFYWALLEFVRSPGN